MTPAATVTTHDALTSIAAEIVAAQSVSILCHTRPDADTIGSGIALGLALRGMGKSVEVGFAPPTVLPAVLASLPGGQMVQTHDHVSGEPLVIAVDCASIDRLGALADVFTAADRSVVIDHHKSNAGFGDVNVVDPAADCTAVLVLALLDELQVEVDRDIATCLWAGLVTDTGSFRWASPSSHRVAARLLEIGVDGREWSRKLLDTHSFSWVSMLATVLGRASIHAGAFDGAGAVAAFVTSDLVADLPWEESESVIDVLRTTDEVDVAVVFKQTGVSDSSGLPEWTVSMRSKTVDVSAVALARGGGGHRSAAGYSASGSEEQVLADLIGG